MIQMNKVLTLRKYVAASVHDLENLSNKQIVCVSPKKFNDPIDTYFYFSDDDCFKKSKKILTQEIMDTIRISCFINQKGIYEKRKGNKLTSNEILMWTHYADAHKGICLEYQVPIGDFGFIEGKPFDKSKIILQKINYIENLATDFEALFSDSEDEKYTETNFEYLLGTCFFTKDKSFEYENEIRLLEFVGSSSEIELTHVPMPFDYLTEIVFGERCPLDLKYLINCINKQVYSGKITLKQINNHFQEENYYDK